MTPGLCIWEMHTATLLIILEDLTKYYNNMPESAILATYATTPIHMMKGVQAGPNTQTSHLSLTSKAGGPDRATYRVRGTIRSDALTCVIAAISHWSIFRAD